MTFIDALIILMVVSGAWAGYRQGFVAAAISLLGAVALALGALALAPVLVRGLDVGAARTAASVGLVVLGVLIGELIGSWAGRTLSGQITWSPAKAVDRALGAVGQAVTVLVLALLVALPIASAPLPWLSSAIRNSAILTAVQHVAPSGVGIVSDKLRALLNSTGFPDVLGPLDPTPIVDVPAPDSALSGNPVAAGAQPSVLKIHSVAPSCAKDFSGSGFVIGPEHVLTNAHVVGGSTRVSVEVNGEFKPATVVDYDPNIDVAVLYVPGLGLPALAFEGTPLTTADDALVLGYPLGGPFTVSPSRVRSVSEISGPNIYQTQTVNRQVYILRGLVQPGNSGGPLLDDRGKVAGVVFGAAIDNPETGFALTAAQVAPTVAAGLTDTSIADTGACALD